MSRSRGIGYARGLRSRRSAAPAGLLSAGLANNGCWRFAAGRHNAGRLRVLHNVTVEWAVFSVHPVVNLVVFALAKEVVFR